MPAFSPRHTQDPPNQAGWFTSAHAHSHVCERETVIRGVSISQLYLPHSPVHQLWPLQPSCPPALLRRRSRHSQCPRCVSVPPSPTVGQRKASVSAWVRPGLALEQGTERDAVYVGWDAVCVSGPELSPVIMSLQAALDMTPRLH